MNDSRWCCPLVCAVALLAGSCFGQAEDVPYNGESRPVHAKPGEVWCLITIPAQFKTVTEQVMVEPASCRFETIPAEYETRTEKVCVKKECKRCIEVPAEYKTESYSVCVEPCRTEWRKLDCAEVKVSLAANETKGECYGLATIPARYETRTKQVLVTPASKRYETVPAEYETREKRVCVKAECKQRIEIPAKYETRTKEVCAAPERKVWRLTSCTVPAEACEVVPVDSCNTCCCSDFTEIMYDADYRDGVTHRIDSDESK